jgi:hypothetical protein
MHRRDFIKSAILAGIGASITPSFLKSASSPAELAVVKGEDPEKITNKALELLGGMKKYISKGYLNLPEIRIRSSSKR